MDTEVTKKPREKAHFVRMFVRVCALILLIFFFLPSVGVSCQGEKIANVSGIGAATGIVIVENSSGEVEKLDDVNAALWLFIMPLLSIASAIFVSKNEIVSAACSLANIIMMCVFKAAVNGWINNHYESYAKYIEVEATAIFSLYIIVCVLIIFAVLIDKFIIKPGKVKAFLEEIK